MPSNLDWLLDDPRERQMPECYKGVWPDLLVEAIAYHEAGHAIAAVHHGLVLSEVWVGDGRDRGIHGESPSIHGATLSRAVAKRPMNLQRTITFMMADIYSCVAPVASEKMAPHYDQFKTIKDRFPEFYSRHNVDGFFDGSLGDMQRGFHEAIPLYMAIGFFFGDLKAMFETEFIIPTAELMRLYENQIHALAKELVEKRWMNGRDITTILCQSGGQRMPGCMEGGSISPEMSQALDEVQEATLAMRAKSIRNPITDRLFPSPPPSKARGERVNQALAQHFTLGMRD